MISECGLADTWDLMTTEELEAAIPLDEDGLAIEADGEMVTMEMEVARRKQKLEHTELILLFCSCHKAKEWGGMTVDQLRRLIKMEDSLPSRAERGPLTVEYPDGEKRTAAQEIARREGVFFSTPGQVH